jgi:uncharacterized membrane protein YsdA (DUF1294 family)
MQTIVILYLLLAVNAITFLVYGIDKSKARAGRQRIPEATLIAWAAFGGAPGALAGMLCFRHKTRHIKFKLFIPLLLIAEYGFFLIHFFA